MYQKDNRFALLRLALTIGLFLLLCIKSACAVTTGVWTPSANGGSAVAGGVGITLTTTTLLPSTTPTAGSLNIGTATGTGSYWTNPYDSTIITTGTPALSLSLGPLNPSGASTGIVTITFARPVNNPVLHFGRLGGNAGPLPGTWQTNSSTWTLISAGTMSVLPNANSQFNLTGGVLKRPEGVATPSTQLAICQTGNLLGAACGSVMVSGTGITSLTFRIAWVGQPMPVNPLTSGDSLDIAISIPQPTITVSKISRGDVGSFDFTGTNGFTPQAITTTAVDTPVSSAPQTLTTAATPTTITEAVPAGYAVTDITCTGLGTGGTATPNLANGTVTLDAAATVGGSNISCTFINEKIPTIAVQKITIGGFGGPFNFAQTNLASAPSAITTTAPNTPEPALAIPINVITTGTSVTLTETPATGFNLSSAQCTDANSAITGNTGIIGTLSGNILAIPAANVTPGAQFTCIFNNTLQEASLTINKTAGAPSGNTVGSTIEYSFLVTNTGNVTLANINVNDPKVGAVSCPVTTLAPGIDTTCTATYTLTQQDVDAGEVINTATASGTPPSGPVVESPPASTTTIILTSPSLTLTKSAGFPTGITAGDTIPYSFVVTNTGNVTLTSINVNDPKVGAVSCPVTTLPSGVSTTCTATYTLTQLDVDTGEVVNTATAFGTPPTGPEVSDSDTVTTSLAPSPSLTLVKTAQTPSGTTAGSTIPYYFAVQNTGNLTLTGIAVTDPKVGAVSCPVTSLAPGESTTCTATYTMTQADLDAGQIVNTATASGTPPSGPAVTASDELTTPLTVSPALTIVKTAGAPSGTTAGSTIPYSFVVSNTGNVTMTSISVNDSIIENVSCPVTTVAPGTNITCTAIYTITQADIDAGKVINAATATGTSPTGTPVTSPPDATTTLLEINSIKLEKTADTQSFSLPNTLISYSYTITNTGNSIINEISLTDSKIGLISCPKTSIAPKEVMMCAAQYRTTLDDMKNGQVTNLATVTGVTANQKVAATATLTIGFNPDIVRQQTLDAINSFLNARAQVILSNQPDRRRIMNRLSERLNPCAEAPTGSISPSMSNVNINAAISTNELCMATGNFDFWSEIHGGHYWQNIQHMENQGTFNVSYFGIDYLVNDTIVAGILAEGDFLNQKGSSFGFNQAYGNGWLVGPYLSTRVASDLYIHTRAAWGKSNNNINVFGLYRDVFNTKRSLYNAELVGDWYYRQWRFSPTAGFTYYNERQNQFTNAININIPGQTINLGQFNIGPEVSYMYITEEERQITWRLSLQGLYNFNGSNQGYDNMFHGFSNRAKVGVEIRFPSGLSLTPMIQYDGIGVKQFSALQELVQINIPLDVSPCYHCTGVRNDNAGLPKQKKT